MIKLNNNIVNINHFPDGTIRILDCPLLDKEEVTIHWLFENNEELLVLYMLTKHLRANYSIKKMILLMPYIINSRMDRVNYPEAEIFTLKYTCDMINDMKFDAIYVMHPHSNVSMALLNNCFLDKSYLYMIDGLVKTLKPDYLYYPDEGCKKQMEKLLTYPYIFGRKHRNWENGQITGIEVVTNGADLKDKKILMIDDICSYGGTFLKSLEILKQMGADECNIYVTHCENSVLDGDLIKSDLFERIYTTNSIFTGSHDKIAVNHLYEYNSPQENTVKENKENKTIEEENVESGEKTNDNK